MPYPSLVIIIAAPFLFFCCGVFISTKTKIGFFLSSVTLTGEGKKSIYLWCFLCLFRCIRDFKTKKPREVRDPVSLSSKVPEIDLHLPRTEAKENKHKLEN
jgi:hypothetical protein